MASGCNAVNDNSSRRTWTILNLLYSLLLRTAVRATAKTILAGGIAAEAARAYDRPLWRN
jgi:hypothetical protein